MPTPDDSAPPDPPPSDPELAHAAPVEPVEDSEDDPIPEDPKGKETDEELEQAVQLEAASAINPCAEDQRYRRGRLAPPDIGSRVRRRYARHVKDEDFLNEMVQETFLRALTAPDFPRPHETMFTWLYKPASASRKQMMRRLARQRAREAPLSAVDAQRYIPPPDGELVSDRDAARAELVAKAAKDDPTVGAAVAIIREHVAYAMSPDELADEMGIARPALRQRLARGRNKISILARASGLALVLIAGGVVYEYVEHTLRPDHVVQHDPKLDKSTLPEPKDPNSPQQMAARDRVAGLKACAAKNWQECSLRLNLARSEDPTFRDDVEVTRAAAQADAELAKLPQEPPKPMPPLQK